MDPKTNTIIRDGRQSVANPFDTAALEVALALKDELGGRVSVLSMGIPDTCRLLRDAIARGADDALLLSDRAFAGADTLATSYALSMGLDELGDADLVLCGKMAVDGDTAQIGPELGGILGVPCVTGVSEVLEASDHRVVVRHDTDEGTEVVEVPLPAVLTVTKDIATLRAAEGAEVRVLDAATLGADPACCGLAGSPTQVVRSFVPERSHEAATIAGTPAEQAAALLEVFEEVVR